MTDSLKIPAEARAAFAQPLGKLIAGTREETLPKVEKIFKELKEQKNLKFYLVGDIVTQDFLANKYLKQFIKVCIIDEKTQRKRVDIGAGDFFEETLEFKNPAGSIHQDSWELLRTVVNSDKRTLINITEGEEDLLVLPLVEVLPLDSTVQHYVFYGQPPITDSQISIPQGVVVTEVTRSIQKKVSRLLKIMKKL